MSGKVSQSAFSAFVSTTKRVRNTPNRTSGSPSRRIGVQGGKSSSGVGVGIIQSGSDGAYSVQLYNANGEEYGEPVYMVANRATIDDLAVGKHVMGVKIPTRTLG